MSIYSWLRLALGKLGSSRRRTRNSPSSIRTMIVIQCPLSSDARCNTPCRFDIGSVDQDLRECCDASLFTSVGRGKRPNRRHERGRPLDLHHRREPPLLDDLLDAIGGGWGELARPQVDGLLDCRIGGGEEQR